MTTSSSQKASRFFRQTRPGTRPGTIVVNPDAPKATIRVIRYGPDSIDDQENVLAESIAETLGAFPVTWIDVVGLGSADVIKEVGDLFALHRLALEDVVHVHQRPKLEDFDEHLYVVVRMVHRDSRSRTEQLSLFLGNDFVLTWQEHPGDCFGTLRERLQSKKSPIRSAGADYLAYAIIDSVIDAYFPVLEEYGKRIDRLELEVTRSPSAATMDRIHRLRSDIRALERAAWPHRDVIRQLSDDQSMVSEATRTHLRDVHDHTLQVVEQLQSYRELCSDLREYYFSTVNNRMNEIMRVLTIVSTIFIPLSFIAGVYGMNFDPGSSPWNMPELRWTYGYLATLLVMATIGATMLVLFRRSGWIGPRPSRTTKGKRK